VKISLFRLLLCSVLDLFKDWLPLHIHMKIYAKLYSEPGGRIVSRTGMTFGFHDLL
jgi:hypothetical protein